MRYQLVTYVVSVAHNTYVVSGAVTDIISETLTLSVLLITYVVDDCCLLFSCVRYLHVAYVVSSTALAVCDWFANCFCNLL